MTGKRKPGMSLASDHCMHTIQNQSGYYHTEECSDAQFGQSYSQSHHHHPHHQHSSHHHHGENQKKVEQCANCGAIETKGTDQKQKEKEGGKEDEQKGVGGKDKGKKGDEVDCDEEGKENPQGENGAKTVVKLSICSNCYQVRYCSRECQKLHWKHHKPFCLSVRNATFDSDDLYNSISPTLSFAERLQEQATEIQIQHEELQESLNEVILSLSETMERHQIDLPPSWKKRDKQLSVMRSRANLEELLKRCTSGEEGAQLAATKECRKLLSDQKPPIGTLVEMGLVPVFVDFLNNNSNPKLQFEAAWVLTNICSGNSDQTWAVVEAGGVPVLIRLLQSDIELAEQCVWALGNIAADSLNCRDILLDADVVEGLRPYMSSKRISMMKNVTWTMSNLCNGVSDRHWPKIQAVLPLFAQSLQWKDEEILKDVCWSLSYISGGTKERIQAVLNLNGNILRRLVQLLTHRSPSVQHAALITIGNIVTGDDAQTQILLNLELLPRLRKLLSHSKPSILKDTCFTLSNIAAGNHSQIQQLVDAKIFPALLLLFYTVSYEIKVEATWAIANALSNGTDEHVRYLVHQGCIDPMADVMIDADVSTLEAILEGFDHILRVGSEDIYSRGASHYNTFALYFDAPPLKEKFAEVLEHCASRSNVVRSIERIYSIVEEATSKVTSIDAEIEEEFQ